MEDGYEQHQELRALAMRVAALEDNVAFLEQWCEEQQDTLDRAAGPIGYDYEFEPEAERPPPAVLRVVDLRDGLMAEGAEADAGSIFAVVETEYDRRVRQIRSQINRLRARLALSVAPPVEDPPAPRRVNGKGAAGATPRGKVSAKPAGRTAP